MLKKEGYNYDVVCVHDWLSSIAGILVKNKTKVPVAFHVHSTEWGRSGGQGSEVVSYLEWETAQKADRIITVSHAMQEDLVRHGWPKPKISVVWNGVDPERYNPKNCKAEEVGAIRNKYNIKPDEKMILFLGMPMVLSEHPNAKLVVLGKGEQQNDIVEAANRLGISKSVICRFDFVPEKERILHYAASDICVFPSTYEPFGIVSLEAMAMAKPIVVGAQGVVGFREQVVPCGPDQNGVHVNGGNPADIAWGIKEILCDSERAKKLGENGRKRVLQYFTWRKAAEQTLEIYSRLQHPKEQDECRVVDLMEKITRT